MAKNEKAVQFGQRLRELREAKGLNRKQLADIAGLSERGIIKWELGEREPGWFNILALCSALGVNCTAFSQEPAPAPAPERGRPRKSLATDVETDKPDKPAKSARKRRKK